MKEVLLDIRVDTPLTNYTFYNTVDLVNIDDECVAVERGQYPTISIYLEPEERILKGQARAYDNEVYFKLVGSVSLDEETDTPKFEINTLMNTLLSDIKAVISSNYSLNCSCTVCSITRSRRVYNTNADEFRAGDLIVDLTVRYNQSRNNPNIKCK